MSVLFWKLLAMIITVTFNPSIDEVCYLDPQKISKDGIIRVGNEEQRFSPGGGGLNVSKVLAFFGIKSIATGFVGGFVGEWILGLLKPLGVVAKFIRIKGNSRICNIMDGLNQELQVLANGPTITEKEQKKFLRKYKRMLFLTKIVIITGSIPKGIDFSFYCSLINLAKKRNKYVIVDASKDLLRQAIECHPDMVKPNEAEFKRLMADLKCSIDISTNMGIVEAAREELIQKRGIKKILVSLGSRGSLLINKDEYFLVVDNSQKKAVNTTGCGDTLIATFIVFYLCLGFTEAESIKRASAAAAACAMSNETAVFTKSDFENFLSQIEVTVYK